MSFDPDSDLRAAGHRAAAADRSAPPVATIARRVARRRSRRRAGAAAAAVSLVGIGTAIARLDSGGGPPVVAGAATPSTTTTTGPLTPRSDGSEGTPSGSASPDGHGAAADATGTAQLVVSRSEDGTIVLEMEVVEGPGAVDRAADAAAWAEETTTIDGVTVWTRHDGDRLVVAASPSPERYVEASGPPEERVRLEELVVGGAIPAEPNGGGDAGRDAEPWMPFGGAPDDEPGQWEWGFGELPEGFGGGDPSGPPVDPGPPAEDGLDPWRGFAPFGGMGFLDGLDGLLGGACVDVEVWAWPGTAAPQWPRSDGSAPGDPSGDPSAELERAMAELWESLWSGSGLLGGGAGLPFGDGPYDTAADRPDDQDAEGADPYGDQDAEGADPYGDQDAEGADPYGDQDAEGADPYGDHWRRITGLGGCDDPDDPPTSTTDPDDPTTSTTEADDTTSTTVDLEDPSRTTTGSSRTSPTTRSGTTLPTGPPTTTTMALTRT